MYDKRVIYSVEERPEEVINVGCYSFNWDAPYENEEIVGKLIVAYYQANFEYIIGVFEMECDSSEVYGRLPWIETADVCESCGIRTWAKFMRRSDVSLEETRFIESTTEMLFFETCSCQKEGYRKNLFLKKNRSGEGKND